MKIWANLILGAILLCSCGETEHAGVLSETESGKTVAGTILSSAGKPLAKTAVYAVDENFCAARDSILFETESDENGFFALSAKSFSTKNFTLLFRSEDSLYGREKILAEDFPTGDDTLRLDATVSHPSKVAVPLSGFGLSEGDVICLEGTFSCSEVSTEDVQNDFAVLFDVPKSAYGHFQIFGAAESRIPVNWEIDSADLYIAGSDSAVSRNAHVRYIQTSPAETLPDTVSPFEVFRDGKVAVSLWAKLGDDAFGADSNVALFTAMQDSLGFTIRQNATNSNKAIGVELFVDSDSVVISDTSLYGSIKILDGEWHQIAVLLNGKHITVMLDGNVIRDTDFQLGNGFGNPMRFVIGDSRLNGTIENVTVYDGGQDSLFMRTMHNLEKIRFQ